MVFTFVLHRSLSKEYPFVEEPSQELYCPVTYEIMLQPHLTSCCSKHLSNIAADRIQGEGGTCPLCRKSEWSTELDKDVQHEVRALPVFCPHVDRGCEWQGELCDYDSHVCSCPMKDALLKPTG